MDSMIEAFARRVGRFTKEFGDVMRYYSGHVEHGVYRHFMFASGHRRRGLWDVIRNMFHQKAKAETDIFPEAGGSLGPMELAAPSGEIPRRAVPHGPGRLYVTSKDNEYANGNRGPVLHLAKADRYTRLRSSA